MTHPLLSRRGLLKGALSITGAALGARALGPLVPEALAATEPAHFVHVFFNGGFNALFAGAANILRGKFGVTDSNMLRLGTSDVYTDRATFGTLSPFAQQHWAAVGMRHQNALHTTPSNLSSGGERAILRDGGNSYLNQLAHMMGGDSAFKAVYFGDRAPAYQDQPAYQGVSLQRVTDLGDALKAVGAQPPDPAGPSRALTSAALATSRDASKRVLTMNPGKLGGLDAAYGSAIEGLRKVPPKPVTLTEIDEAYGLSGETAVGSWASMLAGAEIMVRGAGSNVVNVTDVGLASWDFHQTSGGVSSNGTLSRSKLTGSRSREGRIVALRTFVERMLTLPDRNVVVCISGEMVRLPNGDHGDGTMAVLLGKHVKTGLSHPVDAQSRFSSSTPGVAGFWAAAAAALKLPGSPFGPNPHAALLV